MAEPIVRYRVRIEFDAPDHLVDIVHEHYIAYIADRLEAGMGNVPEVRWTIETAADEDHVFRVRQRGSAGQPESFAAEQADIINRTGA